jgi:hypothetical protein
VEKVMSFTGSALGGGPFGIGNGNRSGEWHILCDLRALLVCVPRLWAYYQMQIAMHFLLLEIPEMVWQKQFINMFLHLQEML